MMDRSEFNAELSETVRGDDIKKTKVMEMTFDFSGVFELHFLARFR